MIVELLSPGTEKQDLGPFYRTSDQIEADASEVAEIDHWLAADQPQTPEANGQPAQKRRPPSKRRVSGNDSNNALKPKSNAPIKKSNCDWHYLRNSRNKVSKST